MEMSNVERVQRSLHTSDGQRAFLAWFKNETTQLMLAAVRDIARPKGVLMPDASVSLYEHGRSVGANEVLDFLTHPKENVDNPDNTTIKPTYGREAILKETGHAEKAS